MRHEDGEQSDDLERLRLLLFPGLSREEGQRRIEIALEGPPTPTARSESRRSRPTPA